jgi:hypothetical protein
MERRGTKVRKAQVSRGRGLPSLRLTPSLGIYLPHVVVDVGGGGRDRTRQIDVVHPLQGRQGGFDTRLGGRHPC